MTYSTCFNKQHADPYASRIGPRYDMHRLSQSVCRFFDLEAGVDDDEERNGEGDDEDEEQALRSASLFFSAYKTSLIINYRQFY
jgi:hypothetical protein